MSHRKKILLLIPNLDFGGAQRSFSKLSIELAKSHDVHVAVFNTFDSVAYPYGGTLLDLQIAGAHTILGKIKNFIQRVKKVKRIKQEYQVEVCISFLEGADYINLLSKHKEKVIVSIRGSKIFDAEINGWLGIIRKRVFIPYLYKKADVVVAVSEGIKHEMVYNYGLNAAKVTTIYNFYELDKIQAQAKEPLGITHQSIFQFPVIINSGRLHVQKEQAALLQIFAHAECRHNTKLVILGEGNLINSLRTLAKSLNLRVYWWGQESPLDIGYQVYFLGYQSNPFKFISKASLFAFTSSWEGFPNALAEAMICGVPVISTDCPTGPREILAPGTALSYSLQVQEFTKYGVLMPLLNQASNSELIALWAKVMDDLFQHQALTARLTENALERVADFTPERIFKQWEQILNN